MSLKHVKEKGRDKSAANVQTQGPHLSCTEKRIRRWPSSLQRTQRRKGDRCPNFSSASRSGCSDPKSSQIVQLHVTTPWSTIARWEKIRKLDIFLNVWATAMETIRFFRSSIGNSLQIQVHLSVINRDPPPLPPVRIERNHSPLVFLTVHFEQERRDRGGDAAPAIYS